MKFINHMKYLMALLIMVCFSFSISAQDCLQELKQLYKKMESDMIQNEGNIFHLKYKMTNVLGAENGGLIMNTTVEILSQGNKSYYISDQASVYQDAQTTYTVMPSEKEIIIAPNQGESIRQARLNQITNMQERILEVASLERCKEVERNGKSLKEITVRLPRAEQNSTQIQSVSFLIDIESSTLLESKISYVPGGQLASTQMIYESINYNFLTDRLQKPVASELFVSGEQPVKRFEGYKVLNYKNQ